MKEKLLTGFREIFKTEASNVYFAPGRVNLIGEHTDYNGGHVFPCALNIGTYLAVKPRSDKKFQFYSENFAHLGIIEVDLDNIVYDVNDDWVNYPKGCIREVQKLGITLNHGLDLYYFGNIPYGAGLSSSASIELVTLVMLNEEYGLNIDRIELVKMGQRAENQFVGVNCGIMDQFAIGMGKANHAVLLDTGKLKYQYAPLNIEGYSLVVTNTNKRRGLADSKYNERRAECEKALEILKQYKNINALCELTLAEFESLSDKIEDEIIRKRARHAISENERTILAKKALDEGNLTEFGRLMNESHVSLRDDYEVTGKELDTLAALAWAQDGVIGSRMTGAGFGGCTISIVKNEYLDNFKVNVEREYEKVIGYKPTFYVVSVGDGAKKL
ncbi:MAG: galactokinase [Bacilli bacterium]|nr:galactokinase [Bacilli bacterium]